MTFFTDKDPPTALNCVEQQVFLASSSRQKVDFEKPVFIDNVDVVHSTCTQDHGYFTIGSHNITCSARDAANNKGICNMEIRVVRKYQILEIEQVIIHK